MSGPAFHLFGGKGGVGKTTCAAAAALGAAERGARVLVLSTDPAHSLGDALGRPLSGRARRVPTRRGTLEALELDAPAALARWLSGRRGTLRLIAERGTYLDREDVDRFLQLSFPGVDELIALLELLRLSRAGAYDEVVVDTAPTGHTLRLLAMPQTLRTMAQVFDDMEEKHRVVSEALTGASRRDAADALIEELDSEGKALQQLLTDPARLQLRWVLLPEALSVAETKDGLAALERGKISVAELIVNRVTPPPEGLCRLCAARRTQEGAALADLRAQQPDRAVRLLPAFEREPRGLPALREVAKALAAPERGRGLLRPAKVGRRAFRAPRKVEPLPLELPGTLRLLFFGGKGGVGKSTCSAAAALALAHERPERRILLLSTDPARRMGDVLGVPLSDGERALPGAPPNLRAQELDADAALARQKARYRDAVDELFDGLRKGSRFDAAYDRAIVQDFIELAPPGMDELFGILSVMDALFGQRRHDLMVVDTAPTGHALRFLEMPALAHGWVRALLAVLLKYKDVVGLGRLAADMVQLSRELRQLEQVLADPTLTRFVVVTRASELPRLETERLARRLGKLKIACEDVLVNAVTPPGCRRCQRAARAERAQVAALKCGLRRGVALWQAPALVPPPAGVPGLATFAGTWKRFPPAR